jgi:hypothetical protein
MKDARLRAIRPVARNTESARCRPARLSNSLSPRLGIQVPSLRAARATQGKGRLIQHPARALR